MKVRIFDEIGPVPEKEPEFLLRLVPNGGGVHVILVDEGGNRVDRGILLQINKTMEVYRYPSINEELGLSLDGRGRLPLTESAY